MRFSQYMQSWLYDEDGYYAKAPEVGKRGDFFTSVSVSRFFGGSIASYLLKLIGSNELSANVTVCEVGAHHGYLLADLVQFIYTLEPDLLKTISFAVVEPIDCLWERQKSYFEKSFGGALIIKRYKKLSDLICDELFLYANELFDAFAFELINGKKMAFVDNHRIYWDDLAPDLISTIDEVNLTKGEYFVGFEQFALDLKPQKVVALFFDYGEFSCRGDFSARIFHKHNTIPLFENESLKQFYKVADLTADLAFDQLDLAFKKSGFRQHFFKTQGVALIEMGLMDLMQMVIDNAGFDAYQKEVGNVRALIDPAMLGERFKAVCYKRA